MEKANITVVQQIIGKAKECEKNNQQCWLSNETFNSLTKEVGNISLNKEGHLIFEAKGEGGVLKFEIALEKSKTSNAFAKLVSVSEVNWYTKAIRKSLFDSPENSQEIRIL